MQRGWYDRHLRRVRNLDCGDTRIYLEVEIRRVLCRRCGAVKTEQLDFLADNPFYTKRFAYYVGRRCRSGTIKDVAKELGLPLDSEKSQNSYTRVWRHFTKTSGVKWLAGCERIVRRGFSPYSPAGPNTNFAESLTWIPLGRFSRPAKDHSASHTTFFACYGKFPSTCTSLINAFRRVLSGRIRSAT